MIKLKITKASGDVNEYEITPAIEFAFEKEMKSGFHKYFREEEKQTGIYWLAFEAERRNGVTVVPFGDAYLQTLAKVEILDADHPNG
jgi:hypothetical protein